MRSRGNEIGTRCTLVSRCGPDGDVLIPSDQKEVPGGQLRAITLGGEKIGYERYQRFLENFASHSRLGDRDS